MMTDKTKKIIKLGFVSGLSGVLERLANNQLKGLKLAVDEMNQRDGILGRQIKIIVKDDKSDPRLTTKLYQESIYQDKVDFFVGQLSAGTQLAANKETKKAKKILISLGNTNELTMARYFSPYTFHQAITLYMIAQSISKWTYQNLGRKWFIVAADYEWGWHIIEGYKAFAKRMNAKIVGIAKVPFPASKDDDYTKHFPEILKKKPEVLIGGMNGSDQLKFIREVSKAGLKRKMSIMNSLSELGIIEQLDPEDAVGMYWGASFYWKLQDILPIAKKFVSRYSEKFKEVPSAYSAYGYSGAMEALNVIDKVGKYPVDSNKVAQGLEGRIFAHYKHPEWWRPCDHQAFQDFYILKLKGPEERKYKDDSSEIIGTASWDLDIERTCKNLGHARNMWGHFA